MPVRSTPPEPLGPYEAQVAISRLARDIAEVMAAHPDWVRNEVVDAARLAWQSALEAHGAARAPFVDLSARDRGHAWRVMQLAARVRWDAGRLANAPQARPASSSMPADRGVLEYSREEAMDAIRLARDVASSPSGSG